MERHSVETFNNIRMDDHFPPFLWALILIFGAARLFAGLAQRIGQPAVLGELLAGVLIGPSVLGQFPGLEWAQIDPKNEPLHLLAELGVVILLFEIGLETDLGKLLAVGGASMMVALVGVVVPFALGFGVCWFVLDDPTASGFPRSLVATVAGATLTATSVGITARVLAELGRLQEMESRVILGAAILDDVLGLIILAVVAARISGKDVPLTGMLRITGVAFGFLAAALAVGILALPLIRRLVVRLEPHATLPLIALLFAFALAYLANACQPGLAIVGAFAAGLVLARLQQVHVIEKGLAPIGKMFVPLFFVITGAAVDARLLNPFQPANHSVLAVGGLLLVVAVTGKFVAGYAPWWVQGKKSVIGVGMVPRGEVGLIFANTGKSVVGEGFFSALTLVVMLTTFLVPPLLKLLLGSKSEPSPSKPEGVAELTGEP